MEEEERRLEMALVRRAKEGDPEAFGILYQKCVRKIYGYIYARVGNREDAEDLTARVFHQALRNIGNYRDRGFPLSSWLYRIAHNLVANFLRDSKVRKKRGEIFLGWLKINGELVSGPGDRAETNEEREALLAAVRRLSPDSQQLLVLKLVEGMSNEEIRRAMGGRSVGAVKSLYFRTLIALREDLERQGFG